MSDHKRTNVNKRIVIPAVALVAAAVVGLMVIFSSPLAAAQNATDNSGNQTGTKAHAIIGSVNLRQTISNYIKDNAKVSFVDAANTAAKQISNGQVLGGKIGIVQGYLVYTFMVSDTANDTGYLVIVDAGNGQVLYTSPGHTMSGIFGFGGGERGMFGKQHGGLMMNHHDYPMPSQGNNTVQPSSGESGLIDGGQTNI